MKKYLFFALIALAIMSCRDTDQSVESLIVKETAKFDMTKYPENLQKVFAAHGGLDTWNKMQSLTFALPSKNGDEVHTIDLKTRKTLIQTSKYDLGFDGERLWIKQDSVFFQPSQAEFVYNLMFYFYAMPFVLADDGIIYKDAQPLEMNGTRYPGIQISYEAGIGNSFNDEYILYYNPATYKMEWLGYTVTYGREERSDRLSYINYNKWQEINGFLLPEELTWYTVENGKPTIPRGPARKCSKVDVDGSTMDDAIYVKPESGIYVKKD